MNGMDTKGRSYNQRIVTLGAAKIIGLAVRTSNQREADPATGKIPGLWMEFFAARIEENIAIA